MEIIRESNKTILSALQGSAASDIVLRADFSCYHVATFFFLLSSLIFLRILELLFCILTTMSFEDRRRQGPDDAKPDFTVECEWEGLSQTCTTVSIDLQAETTSTQPTENKPDAPPVETLTPVTSTPSTVHVTQTGASNGAVAATNTALPTTAVSSGGSDGVSKGAVAGIAIATAIVGAAIAFLVAFLLFKRRKQSPVLNKYESNPELVSLSKGPAPYIQTMSNIPPPTGAVAAAKRDVDLANLSNSSDFLAGVLPQTADDTTVRQKVSMLFDQIHHHVESFYRDVHASITPSMEDDLARFGTGGVGMAELLQSSSMPTVVIKHALVGYILSITSPETDHEATLFPTEVTGVGAKEQFTGTPG